MHLSDMVDSAKRAISPGRRSHSPKRGRKLKKWAGDESVYLTYHDSHITRNDMNTLADPLGWLEDNVIHFWIQYLENEELSEFPKARIELFAPSMATLLKLNDLKTATEVLGQMPDLVENRTTHIFIPVNNDSITDHDYESSIPTKSDGKPDHDQTSLRPAGTHWSLLVVSLIDNVAFHYDSIAGLNEYDAGATLKGLGKALPSPRALRIVNMQDSPQQTDGSNCGIFTIVIMKHLLLKRLLRADANQKITMSMKDQKIDYDGARKMIRTIIEDRRDEAVRRKSVNADGVPGIPFKIVDTNKTAKKESDGRPSS